MNKLADRAGKRGIERRNYAVQLEVRKPAAGGPSKVEGYASVTEHGFEMWDMLGSYTEVVRTGAFKKTLSEHPQVQLLLNHGGVAMAYTKAGTLRLAEDDHGLHMSADVNPVRGDVRDMLTAIEDGNVDEMSFAFRATRQQWSPDYDQRDILEVDMHRGDVSVVNFGANPATSLALRSQDFERMPDDAARAMLARLEQRLQVVVIDTGEGEDDTAACPECGAMNDADAAFCDQCGASMAPAAAPMAMSLSLARAQAARLTV